jgi:CO/xanthine dehydrogenase Mo-binding subunit
MAKESRDYYLDGISAPETPLPGEPPKPWGSTKVIGKRISRVDAYERVSGSAVYPSDMILPNMLYGAILHCPHPHAKIIKLDTSKAEKMPGVHAVISADSKEADLPWFNSRHMPADKLLEKELRYEGDVVAAVAAETPYQARDAAQAIAVEYEILPFVADERQAMTSNAPKVTPKGNLVKEPKVVERGDTAAGFDQAAKVVEGSYRTECELHTPMELHGAVAKWDKDALTIWESTQGVFAIQSAVAEALSLPLSKVRVIGHYMGGGFGSKLQAGKYTVIAAVLARMTARPVKLFLTREETYLTMGNRPASNMAIKIGAKADGTLTAIDFSVLGSEGPYAGSGTLLVDFQANDLYLCPNFRSESTDVYMNAGPTRPFRAPGLPQGAWAVEQAMDQLALELNMDPIDLRLKNIPTFSQARRGSPPYTSTGLKECLEEGAKAFNWKASREAAEAFNRTSKHIKRGVGMAAGLWAAGGGRPPSTIILKLYADGSANLNMGASDIGTGTKTVMALVVAEELGIDPGVIQIEHADTGSTQYATPSGGSKTVPTESPAVRDAAVKVKQQILDMAAKELKVSRDDVVYKGATVVSKSDPANQKKIIELESLQKQGVVVGVGYRAPNPEGKAITPFAAQFCEVEVNTLTGELKILRFLGAHDSGRVMDRLTYDNQVHGGITMGIGLATTEMRVLDVNQTGKLVNRNWHDYKLPTALDVASVTESLPIELPDNEANTTGAKGLGEPVTIPTAPALANAVFHALGVRFYDTPINPTTIMARLAKAKEGGK